MDNKILFNKNIIKNHVICLSFMILSHTVIALIGSILFLYC